MNKEELIEKLQSIEEQSSITDYEELQRQKIEDTILTRNRLEQELNTLLAKTADENNYVLDTKELSEETKRQLAEQILSYNSDLAQNEATIVKYDSQMEDINRTIQGGKELIEIGKKEIDDLQEKIESGQFDDKLITKFKKDIDDTNLAISDIENMVNDWTNKQEGIKNLRVALEQTNENIREMIKSNESTLEDSRQQLSNSSYINETAYQDDLDRVGELKESLRLIAADNFKQYAYNPNIKILISRIKSNRLTDEEISNELANLKEVYASFEEEDNKNRDQMLDENRSMQNFYTKEIERLETKLANENNYIISTFKTEVRQEELSKIQVRIESNKARLSNLEYHKSTIQNEINNRKNDIASIDSAIEDWGQNSLLMGSLADQKMQTAFAKQLAELQKQKATSSTRINEINSKLEEIEIQVKSINQSIKKDEKSIKEKEQKPITDIIMKAIDESKLMQYKAFLAICKTKEKKIAYNPIEEIDSLITQFGKDIKEELDAPAIGEETVEPAIEAESAVVENQEEDNLIPVPLTNEQFQNHTKDRETLGKETDAILAEVRSLLEEVPEEKRTKEKEKPKKITVWAKAKKAVVEVIHNTPFMIKLTAGILLLSMSIGLVKVCSKEKTVEIPLNQIYLEEKYKNPREYISRDCDEVHIKNEEVEEKIEQKEPEAEEKTQNNGSNQTTPKAEEPAPAPTQKPAEKPSGPANSTDDLDKDEIENPSDLPDYEGPTDNKPNIPVNPPIDPTPDPTPEPTPEPTPDPTPEPTPKEEKTYNINDGDILYTLNPETGEAEVKSNNDDVTSEEAAKDFEDKTGIPSSGNEDEYKDITGSTTNSDGTMDVTTTNPTTEGTTIVDVVQGDLTDQEIADMQTDSDLALAELSAESAQATAENEMGGHTR